MRVLLRSQLAQLVLAITALFAVYQVSQASLPALQALPINGISTASTPRPADTAALSNLYPLVAVATPRQDAAPTPHDIIPVDDAFIPKTVAKESFAAKTPDYFVLLNTSHTLTLQAVTSDGAIINRQFYSYDAPLAEFAYPTSSGKQVTPILRRSKQSNAVSINETPGARHFLLTMSTN